LKINCLGCGFKIDLADSYDDYVGQIKCFACGAVMEIATREGNIKAVMSVSDASVSSVEEFVERSGV
jgi:hypothetical protein